MFKRTLKAERVGDLLFVPHLLTLRQRFQILSFGIQALLTRHFYQVVVCFDIFLCGYIYEAIDLTKDEHYQALKFIEWLSTLDEDTRAAVLSEYQEPPNGAEGVQK